MLILLLQLREGYSTVSMSDGGEKCGDEEDHTAMTMWMRDKNLMKKMKKAQISDPRTQDLILSDKQSLH
jgi:hypothetical protein